MDVQSDHGLLVVSLENCMTPDSSCGLNKTNGCIYTAAMASETCGHETSVLQLAAPIQCISDIRQNIPRIQHQHVTQLQPIQYSQTVSFDPTHQLQHSSLVSNHTLYQPMTVSPAPLHHYTTTNPTLHNPYMSSPSLPVLTPSPSFPNPVPAMDDITSTESVELNATKNDNLSEATYPAEGFDYFLEIQNYLNSEQYPPGISENYKKCLKKRAQNYVIIDEKLHHNRKQPKEVIMRKDQQEDMLLDIHVIKESGVHLGVKKMFSKLHMKYFWRGMYTDVVNFVKKCDKCSDQLMASVSRRRLESTREEERDSEDSEAVEDPSPLSPSSTLRSLCSNTHLSVWKKVEVQVHGPYNKTCIGNEFVLTMCDPVSRWCCAAAVPAVDRSLFAEFIFHSFCNYGFARCSLVGSSKELHNAVADEYTTRVSRLGESFRSLGLDSVEEQQSLCPWVRPLLDRLVEAHPTMWDKHLDHFLFQYRIGELKDVPRIAESPFSMLFSHSPLSFVDSEEDKENVDGSNQSCQRRRYKLNNTSIKCRHCDSSFNSKISYRIHQRKHLGDHFRKHLLARKLIGKSKHGVNSLSCASGVQASAGWKESTVSAIKAMLLATREQRRRRGKYHKYPIDLQEQIALYAVTHGNAQAVKHFTEQLGTLVSESTVRNLVKTHGGFTPTMKEQIGWYAVNYGVDDAAKYFSVSQPLVRKFIQIFLAKRPGSGKKYREKTSLVTKNRGLNKGISSKRYTVKMKEEIGEFACVHSVKETAKYFSEKLKIPIKERTVIRFHKFYIDKCKKKSDKVITQTAGEVGESTQVSIFNSFQQIENHPVTLYQINPPGPAGSTTVCFENNTTSSQNNSSFNYHTVQSFPLSAASYPIALLSNKPVVSDITRQNQQTQTCINMPQSTLIVSQNQSDPGLPHFMASTQTLPQTILTVVTEKEPLEEQISNETEGTISSHDLSGTLNTEAYQEETFNNVTELLTEQEKERESNSLSDLPKTSGGKKAELRKLKKSQVKQQQPKKKEVSTKKRGTYTAYSPEIRAEIGKYAHEHGSIKASQHFAKLLGHEVPESTVRGLREKYLMKKKHCPVTSLGYSQRGRPLRLGKYDELVQECIKDIVRSGEKVSSYLAITTAKEILNKYEPELLEENGGSLKLNITWAKSFLKRIGVHNNS